MGKCSILNVDITKCSHGKSIFEDCDDCEVVWLEARITVLERKLRKRRALLGEAKKKKAS